MPSFKFGLATVFNLAGAAVVLYLAVVLGQTIKRNYELNRQIETIQHQTVLAQDQRDELAYNIQYYRTAAFKEREARAKLGLQMPGENVIILPRPSVTPAPLLPDDAKPKRKPNYRQWLDFLSGRS